MSETHLESQSNLGMDPAGWRAMAWYGWGSPVGLGLFFLLMASTVAVLLLGIHH